MLNFFERVFQRKIKVVRGRSKIPQPERDNPLVVENIKKGSLVMGKFLLLLIRW